MMMDAAASVKRGAGPCGAVSCEEAQLLGAFASLLSSALSQTEEGVKQPLHTSAGHLSALFPAASSSCNEEKEVRTATTATTATAIPTSLPAGADSNEDDSSSPCYYCCSVPSLQLKNKDSSYFPRSSKASMENAAAVNLGRPSRVRRAELEELPMTLLWNLSRSFMTLVDARLRSSITHLSKQARGVTASSNLTRMLVGLLSSTYNNTNPITPTTVVTSFRTLDYAQRTPSGDYVVPLVLETVFDLNLMGDIVAVTVEAPGTIQGSFDDNTCTSTSAGAGAGAAGDQREARLRRVDISLDTSALLASMMARARHAVRLAIRQATDLASFQIFGHRSTSSSSLSCARGQLLLQQQQQQQHQRPRGNFVSPSLTPTTGGISPASSLSSLSGSSLASVLREESRKSTGGVDSCSTTLPLPLPQEEHEHEPPRKKRAAALEHPAQEQQIQKEEQDQQQQQQQQKQQQRQQQEGGGNFNMPPPPKRAPSYGALGQPLPLPGSEVSLLNSAWTGGLTGQTTASTSSFHPSSSSSSAPESTTSNGLALLTAALTGLTRDTDGASTSPGGSTPNSETKSAASCQAKTTTTTLGAVIKKEEGGAVDQEQGISGKQDAKGKPGFSSSTCSTGGQHGLI